MNGSDKKRLLVTGFEPFGGEPVNPSWEAVSRLPDIIRGYSILKLKVPTVYGKASEAVIRCFESTAASAVIAVGQAGGRNGITLEMAAINLRYSDIPDNDGNIFRDTPVNPDGENAYFTTLPIRNIACSISENGFPAHVSYSAGTFVCNDLMYSLLHHFRGTKVKCGFIHVPYIPEQNHPDKPFMSLESIISALEIAAETTIKEL